jgi:hypothetical protein
MHHDLPVRTSKDAGRVARRILTNGSLHRITDPGERIATALEKQNQLIALQIDVQQQQLELLVELRSAVHRTESGAGKAIEAQLELVREMLVPAMAMLTRPRPAPEPVPEEPPAPPPTVARTGGGFTITGVPTSLR